MNESEIIQARGHQKACRNATCKGMWRGPQAGGPGGTEGKRGRVGERGREGERHFRAWVGAALLADGGW